jgi:hypothetical protein
MKLTTADVVKTDQPCPILNDILNNFVKMTVFWKRPQPVPAARLHQDNVDIKWLGPTMEAITGLPWDEQNMPDDRRTLQPRAAGHLLWILASVLEADTIPPTSIVPTSLGGVTAEWHVNGYDLDIVCDPDGSILFYFCDPQGNEHEEPVEESMEKLKTCVMRLPLERQ